MKKFFRLPYLPLVAAPFLLFSVPILTGKALFWGTPSLQFIPWWDFAWDQLLQGNVPHWNPWVGMGAPLIANYQSALFYPLYWIYGFLYLIGGVELMSWGTTIMVPLHMVWAGLGMAYLVEKMGGKRLASAVSGLSFSLSGYLVARAGFLSINAAASWFPWVMAFSYLLVQRNQLRHTLMLGMIFGFQFLAGHAQTAWYTVLFSGLWILYWLLISGNRNDLRNQLRKYGKCLMQWVAAGVLGAALAAVQLLPTLEYLLVSQRAEAVDYQAAMTYSFWPWRFLTLISPDLFGTPVRGTYWGYGNYWEDALYVGIFPLLMVAAFVIFTFQREKATNTKKKKKVAGGGRKLVIFLLSVIVLSFLLAMGDRTPIFPFLYRNVPTFDLFQAPTRFTLWVEFCLALLAGLGADSIKKPRKRGLYWNRLAVAGSGAVTLGAGLAWYFLDQVELTFIRAFTLTGLFALGASVLWLVKPAAGKKKRGRVWQWSVVIFVIADLIYAGWGLNPVINRTFYEKNRLVKEPEDRIYIAEQDEREIKFERYFRFDSYYPEGGWRGLRETLLPNLNMLEKVEVANNFDPLLPGRYQTWMNHLQQTEPDVQDIMLDLMAVNTTVTFDSGQGAIFEDRAEARSAPYLITGCARYVKHGEDSLAMITGNEIDPREVVILEGKERKFDGQDCRSGRGSWEVIKDSPGHLILDLAVEDDGWLMWSQVYYPGWRGLIDGQAVEVHRANYLYQALPVQSGRQQVEFIYQPRSLWLGGAVSGAVILGGLLWVFQRRKVHS